MPLNKETKPIMGYQVLLEMDNKDKYKYFSNSYFTNNVLMIDKYEQTEIDR